jgi:DNA-binding transcriptional MerR regulator
MITDGAGATASAAGGEEMGWSVETLAAQAGVPVRTIREYQTLRILPPPTRRGRVGVYGPSHLRRLRLIARLQKRGYSLAAMRDLFDAWDAGEDLIGVLEDPDSPMLEEAPAVLGAADLSALAPHLDEPALEELRRLGVILDQAPDGVCLPSPSLVRLVDDAVASGVPAETALATAAAVTSSVRRLASDVAALVAPAIASRAGEESTTRFLRRGRVLVAQATSRLLLHELAQALSVAGGSQVADLVEHVKTGRVQTVPAPPGPSRPRQRKKD